MQRRITCEFMKGLDLSYLKGVISLFYKHLIFLIEETQNNFPV